MFTVIRIGGDARWFDLVSPTEEEERWLETELGIDIPTLDDIRKYEPSSRLYRESGAIFMAAQIMVKGDTPLPQTTSVAFMLKNDALVTVRYEQSRTFDLLATELQRSETSQSNVMALIELVEALVDRTSELLENAADAADDMAVSVFPAGEHPSQRRTAAELEAVLSEIQRLHRRVAKGRESLVSLGRMTGYLLAQANIKDSAFRARAKSTSRDIVSVTDHATFVAQNIQFVLDALLGLISVEQNAIVKFFSIVAVVLLPPTLIAAIYGMNFEIMPELTWTWGYPAALILMLASSVLPYLWCRKRGWL
ncbi:magnesium transporter [Roseovarius sp. A46]|uniref:CorA family divalent cation transporter n=1 Tax=Roseovarius sp. A46 TaxID=2109331 RepID=UPI001010F33A|nr:CorA family divalent cation transporter [Roseovarius sp. A46]RXV60761.1 magnesium transporter [Roseovarius sp. A46]